MRRSLSRPWVAGVLLGSAILLSMLPLRAADRVPLASLDLSHVEQGWGTAQRDRSVDGHLLRIGGRPFQHGIGTHSPGTFLVTLAGGSSRLHAWVGIDDEVGKRGSATFDVIGDGRCLWRSGVMRGGDPAKPVDVDLHGVRTLLLLVGDAGDGFEYDHADWAEAEFEVEGRRPEAAVPSPSRDPDIGPAPTAGHARIHSPEVVGVRTGTPFLFTIAATGRPPLKFSARHLPHGLSLDSATGRITGMLARPGRYDVNLRATDRDGSDNRSLRIEVGDTIALTPPLGWNSYDAFGDDVTEAEILANARWLKEHLQPFGYEYVVVDYRWYDPGTVATPNNPGARTGAALATDKFGRLQPAPNRFPSAAGGEGFRALADQVHRMGLKFGIHVMRGIPRQAVRANAPVQGSEFHATEAANTASTCPWCPDMYGVKGDQPAGQAWYDSVLRLYASWGVDLIKVDDMSAPYATAEIEAVRRAIDRCGRSIVLSLSPGDTPLAMAEHVRTHANMWRISGDFWDEWKSLNHQFDLIAAWSGHGGPGHWPDADMIPLGHLSIRNRSVGKDRLTRFTRNEQVTLMSLWALAPSPFMLGMNLPDNDAFTESLLTNAAVIAVNQDPLGKQARRVTLTGAPPGVEVWVRDLEKGARAVGVFNRLGVKMPVAFRWADLGIPEPGMATDLWERVSYQPGPGMDATVEPHGCRLYRVDAPVVEQ